MGKRRRSVIPQELKKKSKPTPSRRKDQQRASTSTGARSNGNAASSDRFGSTDTHSTGPAKPKLGRRPMPLAKALRLRREQQGESDDDDDEKTESEQQEPNRRADGNDVATTSHHVDNDKRLSRSTATAGKHRATHVHNSRQDDHGNDHGNDYGDDHGDDHGDDYGDDYGDDHGGDHGDDYGDDHPAHNKKQNIYSKAAQRGVSNNKKSAGTAKRGRHDVKLHHEDDDDVDGDRDGGVEDGDDGEISPTHQHVMTLLDDGHNSGPSLRLFTQENFGGYNSDTDMDDDHAAAAAAEHSGRNQQAVQQAAQEAGDGVRTEAAHAADDRQAGAAVQGSMQRVISRLKLWPHIVVVDSLTKTRWQLPLQLPQPETTSRCTKVFDKSTAATSPFPIDVYVTDDQYIFQIALPGVPDDDVSITVNAAQGSVEIHLQHATRASSLPVDVSSACRWFDGFTSSYGAATMHNAREKTYTLKLPTSWLGEMMDVQRNGNADTRAPHTHRMEHGLLTLEVRKHPPLP